VDRRRGAGAKSARGRQQELVGGQLHPPVAVVPCARDQPHVLAVPVARLGPGLDRLPEAVVERLGRPAEVVHRLGDPAVLVERAAAGDHRAGVGQHRLEVPARARDVDQQPGKLLGAHHPARFVVQRPSAADLFARRPLGVRARAVLGPPRRVVHRAADQPHQRAIFAGRLAARLDRQPPPIVQRLAHPPEHVGRAERAVERVILGQRRTARRHLLDRPIVRVDHAGRGDHPGVVLVQRVHPGERRSRLVPVLVVVDHPLIALWVDRLDQIAELVVLEVGGDRRGRRFARLALGIEHRVAAAVPLAPAVRIVGVADRDRQHVARRVVLEAGRIAQRVGREEQVPLVVEVVVRGVAQGIDHRAGQAPVVVEVAGDVPLRVGLARRLTELVHLVRRRQVIVLAVTGVIRQADHLRLGEQEAGAGLVGAEHGLAGLVFLADHVAPLVEL
jgi:hypothetical protein